MNGIFSLTLGMKACTFYGEYVTEKYLKMYREYLVQFGGEEKKKEDIKLSY